MKATSPSQPSLEEQDLRAFLQGTLIRRCKTNPKYSLRAFARFLELEPSALSKILSGKRAVTLNTFERVTRKLALSPTQVEQLRVSVAPRGRAHATSVGGQIPNYRNLTLDYFEVIADWYHYAILELTTVQGFKGNHRWIARSLGIGVSEVNIAVERLLRLGFLRISEDGRWIDESGAITTVGNEFTAAALRKLQRHVLEKAQAALEDVPYEQRDQSSMTMAISSHMMPEAKKRIAAFRRELCTYLQSAPPYDRVYQLGISLYPLSQADSKKELPEKELEE